MQVSRQVVFGVGVAFVGLIAIVFFLLGRESNRRHASQPVEVVRSAPVPELPPIAASPPPAGAPSVVLPPQPAPRAVVPSRPAGGDMLDDPFNNRIGAGASDEAAQVRDYFTQMDAIQVVASSTDTGEFANKLLASAVNGDTSGFDSIVVQAQAGLDRAQAISPPSVCRGYHEKMLALLARSVDMMKGLAGAIKRSDTGALATAAAEGNAMKLQLTGVEADSRALKARFGIH